MADAVASFVAERLGQLLIDQVVFLQGVKDEVKWLKKKLDCMLCFLRDADNRIGQWISDIRDAAYDAEDIVDFFILKVEERGCNKEIGFKSRFSVAKKFSSINREIFIA